MNIKQAYLIESLAPLVFRSGKPFGAQTSRQDVVFPLPSSSAGLIRALSIEQSDEHYRNDIKFADADYQKLLSIESQGPFLVRFNPKNEDYTILVTKPANALYLEDIQSKKVKLVRLQPRSFDSELCGSDLPQGLLPIQLEENLKGKPQSGANYWILQHVLDWQQNKALDLKTVNDEGLNSIPLDIRTHVALDDETLSSNDGKLFQTASFDLGHNRDENGGWDAERYGFLVLSEQNLHKDLASFGGERRLSYIKPVTFDKQLTQVPIGLVDTINQTKGFSLTLLTPGIFAQGYLPEWIDKDTLEGQLPHSTVKVRLKGVAIDRWLPVSGWDSIEWKPKATRKAVGAGSVYWFELYDSIDEITLQQLWFASLADHPQDQRDGFGVAILASWASI